MAEQLNDNDLKVILGIFRAASPPKQLGRMLQPDEQMVKDKIVRILTRQPEIIPYCKCASPEWNHEYKNVFCNNCYGFSHAYKP